MGLWKLSGHLNRFLKAIFVEASTSHSSQQFKKKPMHMANVIFGITVLYD
jgi:hypothetical protein